MKKYIISSTIVLLIIIFIVIIAMFLVVDWNQQKVSNSYQEFTNDYLPEIKYQLFSPGLGNERIIDVDYIFKNDILPKTIEFENHKIIVKSIDIVKTTDSEQSSIQVYLTVIFNEKEEQIGFWHPNGKIQNPNNGCLNQNNNYICGGIKAITTDEWNEQPTEAEKKENIINVYYLKRVFLQEIDYDVHSEEWNYVKIAFALYREDQMPITFD